MSPADDPRSLRPRILWPSGLTLALLLLGGLLAFYQHARDDLGRQAAETGLLVARLLAGAMDAPPGPPGERPVAAELDRLAPRIKALLDVDLVALMESRPQDRPPGRDARPDEAPAHQLSDRTVTMATLRLPPAAIAEATAELSSGRTGLLELRTGGRRYSLASVPLRDRDGRTLGQVLVVGDIAEPLARTARTLRWLALLGLGLGGLTLGAFWLYLGRIDATLIRLYDTLSATIERQRASEARAIAQERTLEREAALREQSIAEEQTLGTLLRLALEESETLSYLQLSVDTLLESVPWLKPQPRGGILIAQGPTDAPVLRLTAARNLSAHRIQECAAIPFGSCLCGSAAAQRAIVYSDAASPETVPCLSHAQDGGHYSVPILHRDRSLGVLVLYVCPGHASTEHEMRFLGRIAEVLSVGITRRQVAEDLRLARDDAESASRAKSEFLASMSHEIRTPMNGVLGMAELLADLPLEGEQRELVDTIKKSGLALLTVINDILDFSKIEAGRLELEPIDFDLGSTAHEVTHLLGARAEQKGLELILHYHAGCPRYLVGDAGRIRQILLNLAGNAVKFTEQGHVLIDVRQLAESDGTARIHVRIEDTGIGIEDETLGRLFESFVQADPSTTRRFGGTGLGLAISRQLVHLMGGEIGVESELGTGSCFWFTLPLPLAPIPASLPPPADLSGLHAIVVEDNPINQRVYQEQLRSFGMRTQIVGEPTQAMDCIRAAAAAGDPFQLALLDHMMPGMDGEQVARQILADPDLARLPLVLLTSSGQRGDSGHFARVGFSAYLIKPVLIDTLRQCLARLVVSAADPAAGPRRMETRHTLGEAARAADAAAVPPRFAGRVLLAEDNVINRKVALGMLRRMGIEADTAEDGREALERCRASQYDLVLMDCQMPILDGFDATRAIRALEGVAQPTIVALTANAMESDRERCLAAGMDDYVSKPFRQKDLVAAFERWLPRLG